MWRQNGRGFTWGDAKYKYSPACGTGIRSGQGQSRRLGDLEAHHLALGDSFWLFHRGWPCLENELAPCGFSTGCLQAPQQPSLALLKAQTLA